ncbi:origin recognition complex subunit 5 C-terminus-domain-containing protein [Biscogniauxia mediterranea]|nr:origin recognition complex subunit 5 C-terminus-domain-containing protein [Biscogniauxia mediterranea]
MASTIFELPDELIASLFESFPCRDALIKALATLLYPRAAPCRNLVVHGTEATGKTAITTALLQAFRDHCNASPAPSIYFSYAIVKSAECVTARHLYERTVGLVADALKWHAATGRCENLAALTVELTKMLKYAENEGNSHSGEFGSWKSPGRFVLVFDGIDRQREAPATLLPALARLAEIIPNLTTVFIITAPSPSLLRLSSPPHLYFPPYTKAQYVAILSRAAELPPSLPNTTTPQETADLWARFVAAVHDALARPASRTLPRLRRACAALWPRFTAPVAAGTHRAREFSKLLVAARAYFQDESVLEPGILSAVSRAPKSGVTTTTTTTTTGNTATAQGNNTTGTTSTTTTTTPTKPKPTPNPSAPSSSSSTDLSALLPPTARLLLISAYLASHNAPRHDTTIFSTWHQSSSSSRRGRRGRGSATAAVRTRHPRSKHRKIARKLLGPGVFVLERMVAVYAALMREHSGRRALLSDHRHRHRHRSDDDDDNNSGSTATVDADVGMALATLASLRLLVRVGGAGASSFAGSHASGGGGGGGGGGGLGGADMDRGGKWRVNVGWEVVRGVGRSMGIEVEEWLVE